MKKNKKLGVALHVGAWFFFICLPIVFADSHFLIIYEKWYLRYVLNMFFYVLIFYLNYFYLITHFLGKKKVLAFILFNIVLSIVFMYLNDFLNHLFVQLPPPRKGESSGEHFVFRSLSVFFFLMITGMSVAVRMTADLFAVQARQHALEKQQMEAELKGLKNQLNPHFLFNTLNNIYSLIAFDTDKAQETVHNLSSLLRYMLYESNALSVPLTKDLAFLEDYIALMRIRLSDSVTLTTHIGVVDNDEQIAPLLFISLLENAFKHGVSNGEPSFINIKINTENHVLTCEIVNSYFPKNPDQDKSGSGIGLVNLRRRLHLIYPGRYLFEAAQIKQTYRSFLSINLTEEK